MHTLLTPGHNEQETLSTERGLLRSSAAEQNAMQSKPFGPVEFCAFRKDSKCETWLLGRASLTLISASAFRFGVCLRHVSSGLGLSVVSGSRTIVNIG
jgi:hypothetical protein